MGTNSFINYILHHTYTNDGVRKNDNTKMVDTIYIDF